METLEANNDAQGRTLIASLEKAQDLLTGLESVNQEMTDNPDYEQKKKAVER